MNILKRVHPGQRLIDVFAEGDLYLGTIARTGDGAWHAYSRSGFASPALDEDRAVAWLTGGL